MYTEWLENIFADGWRDPSDDIHRLAVYIAAACGIALGAVSACYGVYETIILREYLAGIVLILGGTVVCVPISKWLLRESKHWDSGYLDAEAIVTGGFLTGFAFLFLGGLGVELGIVAIFFMMVCATIGVTILFLSLAGGLVCAYWYKLPWAENVMHNILIEERYALDHLSQKFPNHPSPEEEGLVPCVRVRTPQGQYYELSCSAEAYKAAKPGNTGAAKMLRYKMLSFEGESGGR